MNNFSQAQAFTAANKARFMLNPEMACEGNIADSNNLSLPTAVSTCLSNYFKSLGAMAPAPNLYDTIINQVEKPLIEHVLRHSKGNQLRASQILGINRNTLRKKIQVLGVDISSCTKI